MASTEAWGHVGTRSLATHPDAAFSLPELWARLCAWWERQEDAGGPPSSDAPAGPGTPVHHHDSLPQALAGGTVEPSPDPPILLATPLTSRTLPAVVVVSAATTPWDPQTAGRAPPG